MGYLDNSSVIVDAILTKKGRELLAKGNNQFNITKFALADDEIDYSLYNPAHPLGTDYYGIAIENLLVSSHQVKLILIQMVILLKMKEVFFKIVQFTTQEYW